MVKPMYVLTHLDPRTYSSPEFNLRITSVPRGQVAVFAAGQQRVICCTKRLHFARLVTAAIDADEKLLHTRYCPWIYPEDVAFMAVTLTQLDSKPILSERDIRKAADLINWYRVEMQAA